MVKKKAKAAPKKKAAKKAAPKASAKKVAGAPKAKAAPAPARKELSVRTTGFEKVKKIRTKSQVLKELSDSTGLSKKEVNNVFDNLHALMKNDLTKGGGTFQVPGMVKFTVVRKPATPARKGTNPFTGEQMMFKAKPARNVVRARPLKGLKDMV